MINQLEEPAQILLCNQLPLLLRRIKIQIQTKKANFSLLKIILIIKIKMPDI